MTAGCKEQKSDAIEGRSGRRWLREGSTLLQLKMNKPGLARFRLSVLSPLSLLDTSKTRTTPPTTLHSAAFSRERSAIRELRSKPCTMAVCCWRDSAAT
uniref:Uncharacterized protein n=1 Tax=Ascaris lumbricoides TaxID=6252 RepID=A0A0M3HQ62_ASCLU